MVFSCTEICTTSTNEHRTSQKKKNYLVTHKCVQLHTDHSNPKHKKKKNICPQNDLTKKKKNKCKTLDANTFSKQMFKKYFQFRTRNKNCRMEFHSTMRMCTNHHA
jgi:hypothetical protein